jgi:hypothetical protein
MDGGKFGPHTLSAKVSSAERLLVHWKGYVENQGLRGWNEITWSFLVDLRRGIVQMTKLIKSSP